MTLKEGGLRGSLRNVGVGVAAIPDSGLLHNWPVSDSSSPITDTEGSNDITVQSGGFDDTTATWKNDWAFETDGVDDYGIADTVIDESAYTLIAFLYPRRTSTTEFVISNGENNAHWPAIRNDSGSWNVQFGGSGSDTVSGGSVDADQIQMIAGRYDGSNASVVKNTTEQGTATLNNDSPSPTVPLIIGARDDGSGGKEFYYDGFTDRILFYNEYKSDSELQQIYDDHPST